MTSPSDLALQEDVLAAARGDRDAFGRLVVATDDLVTALLLAATRAEARDPAATHAAVAAVYLEAWDGLGRLADPGSFLPWLRLLARRRARGPAEAGGATAVAGAGGEAPALAPLDALPEELHEAVLLHALEGHSAVQVGRLLGLPDGAVHERVDRARLRLGEGGAARLEAAVAAFAPGGDLVAAVLARLPRRAAAEAVAEPPGGFPTVLTALKGMLGGLGAALLVLTLAGVAWRACGPAGPPPAAGAGVGAGAAGPQGPTGR